MSDEGGIMPSDVTQDVAPQEVIPLLAGFEWIMDRYERTISDLI